MQMQTISVALGAMVNAEPVPASSGAAASGFAQALGSVQSGAPPGTSPPSTGIKVGEEVANQGPIAQSLIPDFPPQASQSNETVGNATINGVKPARAKKLQADDFGLQPVAPATFAFNILPPIALLADPRIGDTRAGVPVQAATTGIKSFEIDPGATSSSNNLPLATLQGQELSTL